MRPTRRPLATTRSRAVSAALAGAFMLAACGGGSDSGTSSNSEPASEGGGDAVAEVEVTPDDLVVASESEIETNVLPDVVVDNLILANKVNLRNVIPSEKVVLVWMWAPH